MVQIKIIRHSERLDYTYPFYWLVCFGHYWADSPLTTNGHKIAKIKGKDLSLNDFKPAFIYTSPYSRTMATSTEIKSSFPTAEIIIEPLLAEYQQYMKDRIALYPTGIPTTYEGQPTQFSYPESYKDFSDRIQFIISKLIEKTDKDFIVVTHGEVLKVYINYLQTLYPDLLLDPGSTPYLTTLNFTYDKESSTIDVNSIRLD